jgi:RNA polymerase sigma factor (sigma-70 family)
MHSIADVRQMTDADLVGHYKTSGDLVLLGELYNRYMPMVFGVSLKYLKNREEARDAVMQIFEKLVQSLKDHSVEHFKSWLYVTARNYCLMQLRSQKGKNFVEMSPSLMETDYVLHPEDAPEKEADLTKMEGCIEKLVNEQKACVQLFYLQQKCYKEITSLTGYDLNNVKSYIQNGKRNLKLCMENNG